ncbi:Ribosomal protein S18 acetylase RimI [Flexibacter flexilis DSM 6793]|uniref:Ribosomal protein S18 acetylase RimI n=1 Tax=Flexibacter flexilis DSM 6793 TaxID=927664 RepID=A0A1I1FTL6_9BACT|nr:GNAT family N-acetyltransferase [Flexibacter flexilis]SFC02645.1 Ribosomal protein S18 acetylase RimI [Flexibacter flexilis DSM 6793]
MKIRAYQSTDQAAVMELLRLNTPTYFAPEESQDLRYYLDNEREYYFVVEENGTVVGCGGFNCADCPPDTAKISWDIFHPDSQGKGLGTALLKYRLEQLQAMGICNVVVRTSQLVYCFYEKLGFKLVYQQPNYWAEGFDLYQMLLILEQTPFDTH